MIRIGGDKFPQQTGHNSIPTLQQIACSDWTEIGKILEPHLSKWPDRDPVGDFLRRDLALPGGRQPEDYAAIVLLELAQSSDWEQLEKFGPVGQSVATQLRAVLDKTPNPEGNEGRLHRLVESLDRMPSTMLRAQAKTLEAQIQTLAIARSAPVESGLISGRQAAAIGAVSAPNAATKVSFATLAEDLAYGGSEVLALIKEEVAQNPDGPFAFAFRFPGAPPKPEHPGEGLGDLVVLLSRFRSRTDPSQLDADLLRQSFGDFAPRLLATLDKLSKLPRPPEPNLMTLGQMIAQLGRRLPKQKAKLLADDLVRRPNLIPKSNPVLDRIMPHVKDGALEGQGMLAVQHLLPSVCNLFEACMAKGMRADRIHVLATPYNCNPLVASYLELMGVHVQRSMSFGLDSRGGHEVRSWEISKFLGDSLQGEPPPGGWKVLDDGGLLHAGLLGGGHSRVVSEAQEEKIRKLCQRHIPFIRSSTEQTTRGLTEIRKLGAKFPIFTVANQPGKDLEGILIGAVLARSMLRELVHAGRADEARKVLNISAGTIGLEAARQLRGADFDLELYDLDPKKRQKAREAGFEKEVIDALPEDLNKYDAILTSTGRRALHLLQLINFGGLVGSGSSMSVDFDGQMLGPLGGHLNRSLPLNFTGSGYERLTPEQIGATISLLFLGVTADVDGLTADEHDLNHDLEKIAVDAWVELGGSKPPAVVRPSNNGMPRPDEISRAPTHDEWMTYLSVHPAQVTPRPNSAGFVEGVYFFEEKGGGVRCVDTRSGQSYAAPELDRVPERIAAGGFPPEKYPMVLFDPGTEPYATVRIAHGGPGDLQLSQTYSVDRVASHYYKDLGPHVQTSALGPVATQLELGLVFERDDQYLVLWPGRWAQPEIHPKPFGDETAMVMENSKRLCCIHKPTGAMKIVGEPRPVPAPIAQPISNVKQFLRSPPYDDLIAVGTSASGKPAVGLLSGAGWHAYELPEGAIVHDVYWPGDIYRFKVSYTLPGEPVEPENMKEVEFVPLGSGPQVPAATWETA